jgi:hypothetical protein
MVYQFNDDSEPVFSRDNLHNLLISRIGIDLFNSGIQRLKETKAFNHNEKTIYEENEIIFDSAFLEFLKEHIGFVELIRFHCSRSCHSQISQENGETSCCPK